MANGVNVIVAGENLVLTPHRALYWPRRRTLVVADLHWGKSETFVASGVPLALGATDVDLQRLSAAITDTMAERLLVLGDLVHARRGLTPRLVAVVASWRSAQAVRIELVTGNHDTSELPQNWHIERQGVALCEGPFCFRHTPEVDQRGFVWGGHLHPTVRLEGGGDKLRLPCFYVAQRYGVLPAFSTFTNGLVMSAAPGVALYAVADGHVVPL